MFTHGGKRVKGQFTHGVPGGYSRGCRCDDCREAWRVYNLRPKAKGYRKAEYLATKWVRENRPDVWRQILDEIRDAER